jgi:rSAM/selenodomain-associated transferase 1
VLHLILFAKRPRLGAVKTRLVPPLSPRQALDLYRAFLDDQIRFLREFAGPFGVEVCLDGPWDAAIGLGTPPAAIAVTEQGSGDLGRRLLRAFRRSREAENEGTIVIGADSPTLPANLVRLAFARLDDRAPAVIAPADDGGFVLLGLREPVEPVFRDVPWGGSGVFEATRANARAASVGLVTIDGWYDVDDGAGLDRLRAELRRDDGRARAPATARELARIAGSER